MKKEYKALSTRQRSPNTSDQTPATILKNMVSPHSKTTKIKYPLLCLVQSLHHANNLLPPTDHKLALLQ